MADVGKIRITVDVDNRGFSKGIKDSEKKLGRLGNAAKKAGGFLAGALAGAVIINGIKNAIKSIAQLESSIKRVSLIAGGGEKEFAKLAKTLGSTTVFTANEAAGAMQFLAQAGFKTNQILAATPGVLNLAAAAQLDLGRAADIASNILSGFGLAAEEINRVNDILVITTNSANLSVEQMGESMKVVAPIAKSAGISINEVAGFMGVLGDAGLQGSLAGTALKGAISSLLKPSKEAASVMKGLGVEIIKNTDGSIDLSKTLRALKDAGLSTADAFTIFGERSAAGALVMANAADKADKLTAALGDESGVGAAARQAKEQLDTLSGDLDLLESAWDGQIQKGGAFSFILRSIVQNLTDLANANFGTASAMQKATDEQLAQFAAAIKLDNAERGSVETKKQLANTTALVAAATGLTTDELDKYIQAIDDTKIGDEAAEKLKITLIERLSEQKRINDELIKSEIIRNENIIKRIQGTKDLTEAIELQNLAEWGTFEVVKKLNEEEKARLKSLTSGIVIKGVDTTATDTNTKATLTGAKASGLAAVETGLLAAANRDGAKAIVKASLAAAIAKSIETASFFGIAAPIVAAASIAAINGLFAAIPEFAAGTPNFAGGLAQINERGGEVVDLPSGSRIIPSGLAKGAMGGVSIVVHGFVGNEEQLARNIQEVLDNQESNTTRLI